MCVLVFGTGYLLDDLAPDFREPSMLIGAELHEGDYDFWHLASPRLYNSSMFEISLENLTPAEREKAEVKKKQFTTLPARAPCPICRIKMGNHCRDKMRSCLRVYLARELSA